MNSAQPQHFRCYFCNKEIKNETSQGHLTTCGSVLEPCPRKCGSYIQRNMIQKHSQECVNVAKTSNYQKVVYDSSSSNDHTISRRGTIQDPNRTNRKSLDMNQLAVQTEYLKLTTKMSTLDQSYQQMSQILQGLQANHQENLNIYQNNLEITRKEMERIVYQQRIFLEWKKVVDMEIEKNIDIMKKFKINLEALMHNFKTQTEVLGEIERNHDIQKNTLVKGLTLNQDKYNIFKNNLDEFKEYFMQETAVSRQLWDDHDNKFNKFNQNLSDTKNSLDEMNVKHSSLVFDVRATTQISMEASEKLEAQERRIEEIKRMVNQFKLDLEVLEDNHSNGNSSIPGLIKNVCEEESKCYLIWKISDFNMKMESCKDNNAVLKSPIFFSHEYGYKIRILVYLNGIKKWKGRHLIACIHVMNGEYDLLLKWPCHIEGTISLKDLQYKSYTKDYRKTITAKRNAGGEESEDPQESSTQYIFIPHTTLTKSNYVQDDTIFFEIKIENPTKKLSETTL